MEENSDSGNDDDDDGDDATKPKKDLIKYEYDEHYFLTDPEDFIMEFWPYDPKWQLLDSPISLQVG